MTGLPCLACEFYLSCDSAPYCPSDQHEKREAAKASDDLASDDRIGRSATPDHAWQTALLHYRAATALTAATERKLPDERERENVSFGAHMAPDDAGYNKISELQADAASQLLNTPSLDIASLTEKFAIVIDEFGDPDQILQKLFKDLLRIARLDDRATKS